MIAILIAVLLVGFPVGVRAATPAGPPVSAHVYLLRGVLNIFSLGLDQIAAKLRAQGVPGVGHLSIDKNEIMQQRVITAIDAVVFSRRKEVSVMQRPSPNASAAAAPSSARN